MIEEGDTIEINIADRSLRLAIDDDELQRRRNAMDAKGDSGWQPADRDRVVSRALQAYGMLASSASQGAVRDLDQLRGR